MNHECTLLHSAHSMQLSVNVLICLVSTLVSE